MRKITLEMVSGMKKMTNEQMNEILDIFKDDMMELQGLEDNSDLRKEVDEKLRNIDDDVISVCGCITLTGLGVILDDEAFNYVVEDIKEDMRKYEEREQVEET